AMQFTVLLAIEQIGEAVVEPRQKDRDPWPVAGKRHPPFHLEALGNSSKVPMKLRHREIKSVQVPLKTHQEQVEINILVLLRLDDIGAVLVNKVGHGGHNALLVRTRDQEH